MKNQVKAGEVSQEQWDLFASITGKNAEAEADFLADAGLDVPRFAVWRSDDRRADADDREKVSEKISTIYGVRKIFKIVENFQVRGCFRSNVRWSTVPQTSQREQSSQGSSRIDRYLTRTALLLVVKAKTPTNDTIYHPNLTIYRAGPWTRSRISPHTRTCSHQRSHYRSQELVSYKERTCPAVVQANVLQDSCCSRRAQVQPIGEQQQHFFVFFVSCSFLSPHGRRSCTKASCNASRRATSSRVGRSAAQPGARVFEHHALAAA